MADVKQWLFYFGYLFFFAIIFVFYVAGSLYYSSGWLQTHSPLVSPFLVLGLQVCTTKPGYFD
jgi:hypothetical protein